MRIDSVTVSLLMKRKLMKRRLIMRKLITRKLIKRKFEKLVIDDSSLCPPAEVSLRFVTGKLATDNSI